MTDDIVRRDFINAYAEKWNTTEEYTDGLMEHVETGAKEDALADFYQLLCTMHMDVLLNHGGKVASGVALAIKAVQTLIPEDKKQAAVEGWAETPQEGNTT